MNNAALAVLFWTMIGLSLTVFAYPWRFHNRVSRIVLHSPLALLGVFIVYELVMPVEMNIRVDLFVLLPMMGATLLCYVAKLVLLKRRPKSGHDVEAIVPPTSAPLAR